MADKLINVRWRHSTHRVNRFVSLATLACQGGDGVASGGASDKSLPRHRGARRAFTLIELLVVIAIIALLVGILLPSLAKSRNVARLAVSLSNCRSINVGVFSYKTDYKDALPIVPSGPPAAGGGASWCYGGKYSNARWAGDFDMPAGVRPLNSYLYPDVKLESTNPTNRNAVELEVYRSPGDKKSYQDINVYPNPHPYLSSYNDVGTSYHMNFKWWAPMLSIVPFRSGDTGYSRSLRMMKEFSRRFAIASVVDSTKYVFMHDQTADIVANDDLARNWIGEFGDRNKSVISFLDGHVSYITVLPGQIQGPDYNFHFKLSGQ